MKRIIIGSYLAGVMTVLLLFDIGSFPIFGLIWAAIVWFGISVWIIVSGAKSLKKVMNAR